MIYINNVQLFVTFKRKSTKTQFWSDVTKISWTQKPCSYIKVLQNSMDNDTQDSGQYTLPCNENIDLSKLKTFVDDNLYVIARCVCET